MLPTKLSATLQDARARLVNAKERRNYEMRVHHKDSHEVNREIEAAKDAYIPALEAALMEAQSEVGRYQIRSDIRIEDIWLDGATVYDYNRTGILALKADGLNVEQLKAWADKHQKLIVLIYTQYENREDEST